jgi:hypothetical protein
MLTEQEIFDKALQGVRAQGGGSWRHDFGAHAGYCAYRGDDGSKCAVGHLILDEYYLPSLEGAIVAFSGSQRSDQLNEALRLSGVDTSQPRVKALLQELQVCHDVSFDPESCGSEAQGMGQYERKMQALARRFSLVYTSPATT